jgi:hypothetical protein
LVAKICVHLFRTPGLKDLAHLLSRGYLSNFKKRGRSSKARSLNFLESPLLDLWVITIETWREAPVELANFGQTRSTQRESTLFSIPMGHPLRKMIGGICTSATNDLTVAGWLEGRTSGLSLSPLFLKGRKVVFHRAEWITVYVLCAMAVCVKCCRLTSTVATSRDYP